jgi:hypothetical protein
VRATTCRPPPAARTWPGNIASKTVAGIKIDRTAPTTTATVPQPLASGWYGDAVQVTLSGHDGLSGVDRTHYKVDGAAAQTYTGAITVGTEEEHSILLLEHGRDRQPRPRVRRSPSTSTRPPRPPRQQGDRLGDRHQRRQDGTVGHGDPAGRQERRWLVPRGRGRGFTCNDPALHNGSAGSGVATCPADVSASGDGAARASPARLPRTSPVTPAPGVKEIHYAIY